MNKQAILTSALAGAALGPTIFKNQPVDQAMIQGALLGTAGGAAFGSLGLSTPMLLGGAGGAYLGSKLTPDQPYLGGIIGGTGGTAATAALQHFRPFHGKILPIALTLAGLGLGYHLLNDRNKSSDYFDRFAPQQHRLF